MRNQFPKGTNPPVQLKDENDVAAALLAKEFKDEESSSDEEYVPEDHPEVSSQKRSSGEPWMLTSVS